VFFDTQDARGKTVEVNAKDATNEQFDMWAKTLMVIHGENKPWSMEERANFCSYLSYLVRTSSTHFCCELWPMKHVV